MDSFSRDPKAETALKRTVSNASDCKHDVLKTYKGASDSNRYDIQGRQEDLFPRHEVETPVHVQPEDTR